MPYSCATVLSHMMFYVHSTVSLLDCVHFSICWLLWCMCFSSLLLLMGIMLGICSAKFSLQQYLKSWPLLNVVKIINIVVVEVAANSVACLLLSRSWSVLQHGIIVSVLVLLLLMAVISILFTVVQKRHPVISRITSQKWIDFNNFWCT